MTVLSRKFPENKIYFGLRQNGFKERLDYAKTPFYSLYGSEPIDCCKLVLNTTRPYDATVLPNNFPDWFKDNKFFFSIKENRGNTLFAKNTDRRIN